MLDISFATLISPGAKIRFFAAATLAVLGTSGLAHAQEPPPSAKKKVEPAAASLSVILSREEIDRRLRALSKKLEGFEKKIGLGKVVIDKWAGTAELFASYGAATNESWLQCDIIKKKLAHAEERGMSEDLLFEVTSQVKSCDADVGRQRAALKVYDRQLESVEEEVNRIDEELKTWNDLVDQNVKDQKALELEKQLSKKVDDVNSTIKNYNPNKKTVPTN